MQDISAHIDPETPGSALRTSQCFLFLHVRQAEIVE